MTSDGISQTGNGAGIGRVPLNSSTSRIDARLLTCGGGTKALQSDLAINNLDGLAIAKDGRTDCLQGLVRLNNVQVGGRFRYDANIFAIKISAVRTTDFNSGIKVRNFYDVMGYIGYVSGNEADRRKLYITDMKPLVRRRDGEQFAYSVFTKSIGSGKESRFTLFNREFKKEPVKVGDIIYCKGYQRDGEYFKLTAYDKVL